MSTLKTFASPNKSPRLQSMKVKMLDDFRNAHTDTKANVHEGKNHRTNATIPVLIESSQSCTALIIPMAKKIKL